MRLAVPMAFAVALALAAATPVHAQVRGRGRGAKPAPKVTPKPDPKPDPKADPVQGADGLPARSKIDDPMLAPLAPPDRLFRTWQEVVEVVRARSTDLRIAYDEVDRAQGRWRVALAGVLPTVNAQGALTHNFLQSDYPFGAVPVSVPSENTIGVGATASLPLIAPRAWNAISGAAHARDAARLSASDRRRAIAQGVADALVAELTAERVAELNRVGLRQALDRLALTRRAEELGSGTQLDVVRAEQDVDAARASLVAGDESARQSREALALSVGLSTPVGVAPDLNIAALVVDTGTGCRVVAGPDERADVMASREQIEVAKRNVADVWYQFLPSVSAASTLASSNDILAIPKTTWNIQAILAVPIWDGGARYGNLKAARAEADQAGQRLEAQRRGVTIEVAQARRAITVAEDSLKVAASARDHAARVDKLSQTGYLTGQGTSLDVIISAAALRQAEINLALRDFALVKARIDAVLVLASCGL